MPAERKMTEHERRVYKEKMKALKKALQEGNKNKADRIAFEIQAYFGTL